MKNQKMWKQTQLSQLWYPQLWSIYSTVTVRVDVCRRKRVILADTCWASSLSLFWSDWFVFVQYLQYCTVIGWERACDHTDGVADTRIVGWSDDGLEAQPLPPWSTGVLGSNHPQRDSTSQLDPNPKLKQWNLNDDRSCVMRIVVKSRSNYLSLTTVFTSPPQMYMYIDLDSVVRVAVT